MHVGMGLFDIFEMGQHIIMVSFQTVDYYVVIREKIYFTSIVLVAARLGTDAAFYLYYYSRFQYCECVFARIFECVWPTMRPIHKHISIV